MGQIGKFNWKRFLLYGALGLSVFLVALVIYVALGNKKISNLSGVTSTSLKLQRPHLPVSKQMQAYMTSRTSPGGRALHKRFMSLWRDIFPKRHWFTFSASAKLAVALSTSEADVFLKALQEKGCPPNTYLVRRGSTSVSYESVKDGLFALGIRSVGLVQLGMPEQALGPLLAALSSVNRYIAFCSYHQASLHFWLETRYQILEFLAYVIVHPSLSAPSITKILRALYLAERPKINPSSDAVLSQSTLLLKALRRGLSSRYFEGILPTTRLWPWWDQQLTFQWLVQTARAQAELASQPFSARLFRSTAEEKALGEMHYGDFYVLHESYQQLLMYNSIGGNFLWHLMVLRRRSILKWHQFRCLAAARRFLFLRHLRQHKRPIPAGAIGTDPVDPLTQKPFVFVKNRACAVWNPDDLKHPRRSHARLPGKELLMPIFPKQ